MEVFLSFRVQRKSFPDYSMMRLPIDLPLIAHRKSPFGTLNFFYFHTENSPQVATTIVMSCSVQKARFVKVWVPILLALVQLNWTKVQIHDAE